MTALHATAPAPYPSRLPSALVIAAVLHAAAILGIRFADHDPLAEYNAPTLDITLVNTATPKIPENPDYLAQANQDGAGNVKEQMRPESPAQGLIQSPGPQPMPEPSLPIPEPAARQEITAKTPDAPQPAEVEQPPAPAAQPMSGAELITRSLETASLDAKLSEALKVYTRGFRHKRISARTQEYRYAMYLDSWINKIEQIGTLNYPDAARRQDLSGDLLLNVAINSDGSLHGITLLRSSGYPALDEAALRIVRLAAPFAPLPPDLRAQIDVLHIVRVWEFLSKRERLGQ